MAIKQIEAVVCDFKHKHDTPAVSRIEIDVCTVHERMFADRAPDPIECPECGRTFGTQQGMSKHFSSKHSK